MITVNTDLGYFLCSGFPVYEEQPHPGDPDHHPAGCCETVNWKRYRTRIGTMANQVNLKFEEALPEIQIGLCKCIAGLF
jgi:hypothetical protein